MPVGKMQHDHVTLQWTDQGAGKPVVLIHGFPFDHTMWQAQIDALSETCRVIAPDLRGYGKSTLAPESSDSGIDMRGYADDLLVILNELGVDEPVILCGFSMGGYILWQFALAYPERVAAMVACDTRSDADSAETQVARLAMAEDVVDTNAAEVPAAMLPKLLAPATFDSRPELVEQVRQWILAANTLAIAASQRGMARRPDVTWQLPELEKPALAIVGSEDAISPPAHMREIAEALPNCKYVEIPKSGHMTVLENPAAVNQALSEFIGSL